MKHPFLFLLLYAAGMMAGCTLINNNPSNPESVNITCTPASIKAPAEGGTYTVRIKASAAWSASANRNWVSLDSKAGQGDAYVEVIVASGEKDSADVIFAAGKKNATLTIWREGKSDNPTPTPEPADTTASVEGRLSGRFSVSPATGVYFSRGNLQCRPSEDKWSFAEHQYDYVGEGNANCHRDYRGQIDLFGWSTSSTYYGVKVSTETSDFSGDFADWGSVMGHGWYTLSKDEWNYLVYERTNADRLFGVGRVCGVNGCILLPDKWVLPAGLNFMPGLHMEEEGIYAAMNDYSVTEWTGMEEAGAVFLPAGGFRRGENYKLEDVGEGGCYWSSTKSSATGAYQFYFLANGRGVISMSRNFGKSVRLVIR